jgi:hypothetical protein
LFYFAAAFVETGLKVMQFRYDPKSDLRMSANIPRRDALLDRIIANSMSSPYSQGNH